MNLNITRHAAKSKMGHFPTDALIWKKLRSKTMISKRIQNFFWRSMHDGYRLGNFWKKIQNNEHRGECQICDTTETMEHILTKCKRTGQEIIWHLVETAMRNKGLENWTKPTYGEILACPFGTLEDTNTNKHLN